jgi:hypothetical protein
LDDTVTKSVRVTNRGTGPCEINGVSLTSSSDSQFHVDSTSAGSFVLESGSEQSLSVVFHAQDSAKPHHRTGDLEFKTNDTTKAKVDVPLSADIDVGCALSWVPTSLDFGNVILNTKANGHVTLTNDGSATCFVSGIAITLDSDPSFELSSPSGFAVSPGANATIDLVFSAGDSTPPHLRTGTLVFQTGNPRNPAGKVPLSAYVNSVCVEASRWIYTVDESGLFSRFDPSTLTFTDIAKLQCPTSYLPNSMAVDQNAVAWVGYQDGNLFRVDTATGACQATGFKINQHEIKVFGMGFVFDPSTGRDTLYIAGGPAVSGNQSTLATVSFPALVVTPIGTVAAGLPEMSGTGDGQLWGFIPQNMSSTSRASLIRIDPGSGKTLESYPYASITDTGAWAMKFWGGHFWIFLNSSVFKVSRDNPKVVETAIAQTNRAGIVGAGVSTCAPLQ